MGTHPIFESDFDCLTEKAKKMLAAVGRQITQVRYSSGKLKELGIRLKSIRNIEKITKTMKMISSANLPRHRKRSAQPVLLVRVPKLLMLLTLRAQPRSFTWLLPLTVVCVVPFTLPSAVRSRPR